LKWSAVDDKALEFSSPAKAATQTATEPARHQVA
jgi:hypothetical protein